MYFFNVLVFDEDTKYIDDQTAGTWAQIQSVTLTCTYNHWIVHCQALAV